MDDADEIVTNIMRERARASGTKEKFIITKDAQCCYPNCEEWAYGYDESLDKKRREYFRGKSVCEKHGGPSWSTAILHNIGQRLKEK